MERLQLCPGHSILSFVTLKSISGENSIVFRLETQWTTRHGVCVFFNESQTFGPFSMEEWSEIEDVKKGTPWTDLVRSHLTRATDMSYLDVMQKLQSCDRVAAAVANAKAEIWFYREPFESVNMILAQRLQKLGVRHNGQQLSDSPCNPCVTPYEPYMVLNLTEEQCKELRCCICDSHILQPSDRHAIATLEDRRDRSKFHNEQEKWSQLKRMFNMNKQSAVTCEDFAKALATALHSFHVPKSAMVSAMSFVHFPETKCIVGLLQTQLAGSPNRDMTVQGYATVGVLAKFASVCLQQHTGVGQANALWNVLPAGYRTFLVRLFMRTMHLAYYWLKKKEAQVLNQLGGMGVMEEVHPEQPDQLMGDLGQDKSDADRRKWQAYAKSSGSPTRPRGVLFSKYRNFSSSARSFADS